MMPSTPRIESAIPAWSVTMRAVSPKTMTGSSRSPTRSPRAGRILPESRTDTARYPSTIAMGYSTTRLKSTGARIALKTPPRSPPSAIVT